MGPVAADKDGGKHEEVVGGGGAGEGAPNSFPRNTQGAHFGLCCPLDFFLTAGHVKGLKSANVVQFSARLHKRRVN